MTTFLEALTGASRPVIMEIKKRDAHGNELVGSRSIREVVDSYVEVGAPCLSVVTGRWFGGTVDLLEEITSLTDLPILQKDFITRQDQLQAARRLGVSAVLLTAALLPTSAMHSLITAALQLGLTPFVEVTRETEVEGLPHAEECVVAVNNKDIKTREKDLGDTERSLRLLPAVLASGTRCPVSASGISHPYVAAKLLNSGYAGLLIGTSLLRSGGDLGSWLTEVDSQRTVPAV